MHVFHEQDTKEAVIVQEQEDLSNQSINLHKQQERDFLSKKNIFSISYLTLYN